MLSCAVFFLRRQNFERQYTKEEVINIFIKRFNLKNLADHWFCDSSDLELDYNQCDVEDNQAEFYTKKGYASNFESITFNSTLTNSATKTKAAGHIQTLYSASGIQECFLLFDEPHSKYYIINNSVQNNCSQSIDTDNIFEGFKPWLTSCNNPDYTGKEKYSSYPRGLKKLIQFMFEKDLIESNDLNELNLDKYISYIDIYENDEDVKEFDKNNNSTRAGIAALKKYIKYIDYLLSGPTEPFDYNITNGEGINKIFYGVPGCGKSYHIEYDILKRDKETKKYNPNEFAEDNIIRTTFYQDYSNTDFVGQILPKIIKGDGDDKDTVEYIFNPGPFTLALIRAISNPTKKVALIVEEINRGNAPAIFGDIFQLLDRDENGVSEYGIVNIGMLDYLNDNTFKVENKDKRYIFKDIKIPANMYIYATMNTSDQNVYTLDTAFTRRWSKERIPNKFNGNEIATMYVPGMEDYTWGIFVDKVNEHIRDNIVDLQVNEDKQVGCFFVKKSDLLVKDEKDDDKKKAKAFAYKVLEYLWDDVSKLDHTVIFNPNYKTFEDLVKDYLVKGVEVFNGEIFK